MKWIIAPIVFLLLLSSVSANNQGLESIDCSTRQGKDTFTTAEDICIKQTTIEQAGSCSDPDEIIQVYVLNYKTPANTPDGSFFYTAFRSLTPYVKKIAVTVNSDRSFYWNLGKFSTGSYDIAQGTGDQYTGGCFDELGSPLVSAGFDITQASTSQPPSSSPCTSDASCGAGYACTNIQPPYNVGTCALITSPSQPAQSQQQSGQQTSISQTIVPTITIIQQIPNWVYAGVLVLALLFIITRKAGRK